MNTLLLLILLPLLSINNGSVYADETSPVIFPFDWPTSGENSTGDYYHIDYGDFIEAQITTIASDPVLSRLPGIAIYKPAALSPNNIRRLNKTLKKHILQ